MLTFIWYLFFFILALSVLITFHEFGHFCVARWFNVKVLKFSIGFGKPLVRWIGRHGTEYVISVLPLGGYVKMLDEWLEEVPSHEKPYSFRSKPIYARILIVLAGPLFNFILAILTLTLMYVIGLKSIKPVIGVIKLNSPAYYADLKIGDEIIKINDHQIYRWIDVLNSFVEESGNKTKVKIEVKPTTKQNNEFQNQIKWLNLNSWEFTPKKGDPFEQLGFSPKFPDLPNIIGRVLENSPAAQAGLKAGDQIIQLGKTRIKNWYDINNYLETFSEKNEKVILVYFIRNKKPLHTSVQPQWLQDNGVKYPRLGVESKPLELTKQDLNIQKMNLADAFIAGIQKTWLTTKLTFILLVKLILGKVPVSSLSGPIGIAQGAGLTASQGISHYLDFLATISISLGVINLLPIPMLDGGHIIFYLIEYIRRKPVSYQFQIQAMKFGLLMLIFLMALGVMNDVKRIFQ